MKWSVKEGHDFSQFRNHFHGGDPEQQKEIVTEVSSWQMLQYSVKLVHVVPILQSMLYCLCTSVTQKVGTLSPSCPNPKSENVLTDLQKVF